VNLIISTLLLLLLSSCSTSLKFTISEYSVSVGADINIDKEEHIYEDSKA